jgi:UDP:flavonoid glycosyltransferase YjiC (YdhE family)
MAALCRVLAREHDISFWCQSHTRRYIEKTLQGRFRFYRLPPMPTIVRNNSVKYAATIKANLRVFLHSAPLIRLLVDELQRLSVDAVIADYEPFVGRAAWRAGIPVVLFNHQGVVNTHPAPRTSWLIARIVNLMMMSKNDRTFVSSFYNGDVGPLLRQEVLRQEPASGGHIFVYARDAFREVVVPALAGFPEWQFRVFPGDRWSFAQSLASCRGVIAPAGHQLTCEVLRFRKPLLVFPQKHQYEQVLNAQMIVRSGWGLRGSVRRIRQAIDEFLSRLDAFPLRSPDPAVRFLFDDDSERAAKMVVETFRSLLNQK